MSHLISFSPILFLLEVIGFRFLIRELSSDLAVTKLSLFGVVYDMSVCELLLPKPHAISRRSKSHTIKG